MKEGKNRREEYATALYPAAFAAMDKGLYRFKRRCHASTAGRRVATAKIKAA